MLLNYKTLNKIICIFSSIFGSLKKNILNWVSTLHVMVDIINNWVSII